MTQHHEKLERLLRNNVEWSKAMTAANPDYFKNMAEAQRPDYLFIGCSDSRVPANTMTGTEPGEMFVHRNIANQFLPQDLNCVSVVQFAVDILDVEHIIVCGHYGCGGVKAAASQNYFGAVDHWLGNLRSLASSAQTFLSAFDENEQHRRLVEFSVLQQVYHVSLSPTIRMAWAKARRPTISGMVYDIETGRLKMVVSDVNSLESAKNVQPHFEKPA